MHTQREKEREKVKDPQDQNLHYMKFREYCRKEMDNDEPIIRYPVYSNETTP